MKMIVRRTALAVCTLVLALILPTAASAACAGFDDVPETADCYESVMYLAECEIVAGTGNDCFSPEQPITVEQWAVMLCRAYGVETIGVGWQNVGRSSVAEAYRQGWLNETALSAPRSPMCRSVLVESAFAAADVPVYDSTLYEGGASLSTADNILRVGRELGLCSDDADTNALVTRGDAAIILHVVLTQSFRIEEPLVPVTLVNAAGVNVNDFLLELRKLPEQILDAFNAAGWTYCIDFDYMGGLSKKLNMSCIGATNYSGKPSTSRRPARRSTNSDIFSIGCWDSLQSMNSSFVQKLPPRRCGTMPKPTPENTSQTALPIASSTATIRK